jgi:hypothetical protein
MITTLDQDTYRWDKVLLLVNGRDVALLDLLANDLIGSVFMFFQPSTLIVSHGREAPCGESGAHCAGWAAEWFGGGWVQTHRNPVRVLLADPLGLSLALV